MLIGLFFPLLALLIVINILRRSQGTATAPRTPPGDVLPTQSYLVNGTVALAKHAVRDNIIVEGAGARLSLHVARDCPFALPSQYTQLHLCQPVRESTWILLLLL